MKKLLPLLIATAALCAPAFAQNSSPTPAPSPTVTPEAALTGSGNALRAAGDWAAAIALAQPFVTGTFVYSPGQSGLTDAQQLNNIAISVITSATGSAAGAQAAHDYAIAKGNYGQAASYSANQLRNPAQAAAEQTTANNLMAPCDPYFIGVLFKYLTLSGQNENAAIVAYLQTQKQFISGGVANVLYGAFNPVVASKEDLLAFYGLLLQSVESNQQNAAFIGKVLDQQNKLNH